MTRRPPAVAGYPDARPIRDGIRLAVWTLRGFAHGAARRKSRAGARFFSAWMLFIGICLFPVIVVSNLAGITLRRGTRYYMTPERDATLAITAKRDAWHVADHSTAMPGTGRGRILRRGIAPALAPMLDEAGAALVTVAVNDERAKDYSEDVPGLLPQVSESCSRCTSGFFVALVFLAVALSAAKGRRRPERWVAQQRHRVSPRRELSRYPAGVFWVAELS